MHFSRNLKRRTKTTTKCFNRGYRKTWDLLLPSPSHPHHHHQRIKTEKKIPLVKYFRSITSRHFYLRKSLYFASKQNKTGEIMRPSFQNRMERTTRASASTPKSHQSRGGRTWEIDEVAIIGFIKLIGKGIIETSSFYIFVILLILLDLTLVILNFLSPSRTNENVIPPAFSPNRPPPFSEYPFVYCLCKLTLWLGEDAPDFMHHWSNWQGITPDGRWPPVDRTMDLDQVYRSPCPALNALANHGILSKSGEGLSFHQIAANVSRTYNLSPTLAIQLIYGAWPLFKEKKFINLEALTAHGLIEHDASLLRPDLHESSIKAQTKPDQELIERFFPEPKMNKGQQMKERKKKLRKQMNLSEELYELKEESITSSTKIELQCQDQDQNDDDQEEVNNYYRLTHLNFSNFIKERREESKKNNQTFFQNFLFKFFGSGNCALLIEVFKGDLYDLRALFGAGIPIKNTHLPYHRYGYLHHHQHTGSQSDLLSTDSFNNNLNKNQINLVNFEVLPHDHWRPCNLHHPWGLTILKSVYSTFKIEART